MAPNEDFKVWYDFLKHIPVQRAAGICSAGEVGFFSILPLVRKELVLVDHSYKSLSIAMVKYLVMRQEGYREAHRLFTRGSREELHNVYTKVGATLPGSVGKALRDLQRYDYVSPYAQHNSHKIQRVWDTVNTCSLRKAHTKLDLVSFLHGDLKDLVERGPFDVLYLSNALDGTHRGRDGSVQVAQINAAVKPGGYVILAESDYYKSGAETFPGWEKVKELKNHTYGSNAWVYKMFKTPKVKE